MSASLLGGALGAAEHPWVGAGSVTGRFGAGTRRGNKQIRQELSQCQKTPTSWYNTTSQPILSF